MDKYVQGIQEDSSRPPVNCYGVVMSYDRYSNTAVVLTSSSDNDEPGEILTNVLCPTRIGVQTVAPQPGRICQVKFIESTNTPVLMRFYSVDFERHDYTSHAEVFNNNFRFMMEL